MKAKNNNRPWENAERMEKLYVHKELPIADIADIFNCSNHTVQTWLEKHDINTRDVGGSKGDWPDKFWLKKQYHQENKSFKQIAELTDYSARYLLRIFREYDIETRGENEKCKVEIDDIDNIITLYKDGNSIYDISEKTDYKPGLILKRLEKTDVNIRDKDEHFHTQGKEHPAWKGGHEKYYGATWPEQRRKTLKRDNHQCRACGITQEEHKNKYERGLEVHHVVPVRKFDNPEDAHSLGNLVTACADCHRKYEKFPVFPK